MIETIKIITNCTGVNSKIEPKRLSETDLSEGVNIDIDDHGYIDTRLGQEKFPESAYRDVPSHSLFCDGGDCFVAQDRTSDTAVYRVNADLTLTGVLASLVKGEKLSYAQVGGSTFYANGYQKGVIINASFNAWPTGVYRGPEGSLKDYTQAPTGHLIAWCFGRMWIAIDEDGKYVIYCSELHEPGLFRKAKYYFRFDSHIRMIKAVAGGVWVSDSETTGFITVAEPWDAQIYVKKSQFPAHEWSVNCRLVDLSDSKWKIPGLCAVWRSDEGLCIGTPDGQLIMPEKEKMIPPTGTSGATVVDGTNVISSSY